MVEKKYRYLTPLFMFIPGVKTLFEKSAGKKDAKENQICVYGDGHITPTIEVKVNSLDSHINKVFLKTSQKLEPIIEEANAMVVEFNLLMTRCAMTCGSNDEEAQRQDAYRAKLGQRCDEILTRLAEIKAESDMVDEMLLHYVERAEALLNSRVSKYWRGVLAASEGGLKHFPCFNHKESAGMQVYRENRLKLIEMIDKAIICGGGVLNVVEEENEEEICG